MDGDGLKGGSERAESEPQDGAGEKQRKASRRHRKEDEAAGEEEKAGVDDGVRAVMIEEVADERAAHDNDGGEDEKEKTCRRRDAEASRIHGNKSQHAAVSEEDESAQNDGGQSFFLKEIGEMEAFFRLPGRLCDGSGQTFTVSGNERAGGQHRKKGEEDGRAEMFDDEKPHERTDDHGHISGNREVADAFALADGGEDERRHGGRCRRAEREKNAVDEPHAPDEVERVCQMKGGHEEKKEDGNDEEESLLVCAVDDTPGKRPRRDGANLKASHRHPGFPMPQPQIVHNKDGERGNHNVLGHKIKEIRETHADKFTGPKSVLFQRKAFFLENDFCIIARLEEMRDER